MTDGIIAFNVKINRNKYRVEPSTGTMPPFSKRYIVVTMEAQANAPPNMWCHDMLLVQSTGVIEEQACKGTNYHKLFEAAMAQMVVDVVTLPIVYVEPFANSIRGSYRLQ
jgi:hypothetical protein